jgi:hypothetical protein
MSTNEFLGMESYLSPGIGVITFKNVSSLYLYEQLGKTKTKGLCLYPCV